MILRDERTTPEESQESEEERDSATGDTLSVHCVWGLWWSGGVCDRLPPVVNAGGQLLDLILPIILQK